MDNLENTKEIENLDELRQKAIENLELTNETLLPEAEEAMDEIEQLEDNLLGEDMKEEERKAEDSFPEPSKKKKSFRERFSKLKQNWQNLSKGKKIGFIIAILLLLILLVVGIVLLVMKKPEEEIPKIPDVILKENNYRYENGTLIFLDKDEKEIGTYQCQHEDQELCYVAYNNHEDVFDEPKQIYENEKEILKRSNFVLNQYAFIYDNDTKEDGLVTLYDFQAKKELEEYALVKQYESLENMVILKNKTHQYGLYRLTVEGIESVIPSTYDYLGVIDSKETVDKIVAKRNNKWYLTDLQDKTLTKAIDFEIKDYNNTHLKVKDENGFYHLVDYNNVEMNADSHEYIDLLENYVVFIKDKTLFLRDYENHKMNIEGIALENTFYLPVSVYSEKDNKLLKTDKSYEISYQGNTLRVEVEKENGKTSTQINLNEGRISAGLKKMDYFDGKLYFYENEEKTALLGTYSCNNKNSMGDETTELNNCKLAKESFYQDNDLEKDQSDNLGTLPIYNKRFVFVSDGTTNNPNIVLYDLKTNETKARYKSVDAGAYTKTNDLSLVTINDVMILAETQNNTFGAIKIGYESVSAGIGFNFNHIERIGFYYLAQDSSGYYLVDQSGKRITDAATNKIVNYNDTAKYVTRKSGSDYYLYPFNGNGIGSGQTYIELYDNYYATVSNHTLKLFDYQNPTNNLLEGQDIPKLTLSNYFGEGTLAFKININNQIVTIQIGNESGTYETYRVDLKEEKHPESSEE